MCMSTNTPSYARPDPHLKYNNGNIFDPINPEEDTTTTTTTNNNTTTNNTVDNYGQGDVTGSNSGLNIN